MAFVSRRIGVALRTPELVGAIRKKTLEHLRHALENPVATAATALLGATPHGYLVARGATVITRLRRDAQLVKSGRRGRPRLYGQQRLSLAKRAGHRYGWAIEEQFIAITSTHLHAQQRTMISDGSDHLPVDGSCATRYAPGGNVA